MQVGAVQRQIGSAITVLDAFAEREGGELAPGEPVIDRDCIRLEGVGADRLEHAEGGERACRIGPELNAGARLFAEAGALQHLALDAAPGERDGSRETADAAAGNEHALLLLGHG